VIPSAFLQIAEGLTYLDPVRSYPVRAAKLVADLVNAKAFRLEFNSGNKNSRLNSTPPPPPDKELLSLPLRQGRRKFGNIELYVPEQAGRPASQDLRLARWATRALARGLTYIERMYNSEEGKRALAPVVRNRLNRAPLTRREKQVVALLVSGASARVIAQQSGLTVATVHTYLKRIYAKLGVHSQVELLARITGTEGSVPSPPPLAKRRSASKRPRPN
jgi:DNA-binding CsgD family transcriptional regulator